LTDLRAATNNPANSAEPGVLLGMVVTASVDDGKRMPEILKGGVFMKNGNNRLPALEYAAPTVTAPGRTVHPDR
jgi:hypothetical protein